MIPNRLAVLGGLYANVRLKIYFFARPLPALDSYPSGAAPDGRNSHAGGAYRMRGHPR